MKERSDREIHVDRKRKKERKKEGRLRKRDRVPLIALREHDN